MFPKIHSLLSDLSQKFSEISTERKILLTQIADFIQAKASKHEPIPLLYVCTHNSRRSHFGQIAATIAADFYGIPNVTAFSGGTETTAFHPNAIQALETLGFLIDSNGETNNPHYFVDFGAEEKITCFSKLYDDVSNPQSDFAAIMTCSDAEKNCPFILGATLRIGTSYDDPKISDNTPDQTATYLARFRQITTETLYVFSLGVWALSRY
jgi:protein-tyrosine-phosphatase